MINKREIKKRQENEEQEGECGRREKTEKDNQNEEIDQSRKKHIDEQNSDHTRARMVVVTVAMNGWQWLVCLVLTDGGDAGIVVMDVCGVT